jgi:HAD superfamily hydrolase (TIGR01509 family)
MVERWRTDPSPLIPRAREAVERLAREWPLAVASSAHCDVIEAALERTALRPSFAVIVSSDEVAHGKPEPDVYLEAARRLGIVPSDCLVVEDSLNGVKSGRAAGMAVVLVPNASIPPAPGAADLASAVVPTLAALDPETIAASLAPA